MFSMLPSLPILAAGEDILWKLAEPHLPSGRAGDYNQALMDLGATICLPKQPALSALPVEWNCARPTSLASRISARC